MRSRTVANFTYLFIAELITKVLLFALYVILTRKLGEVEYGKYSFAQAFTAIFIWLFDFGIVSIAIRDISRNIQQGVVDFFWNTLIIKSVSSILLLVVAPTAVFLLGFSQEKVILIMIISFALVFEHFSYYFRSLFFQTRERMGIIAILRVLEATILTSALVSIVFWQQKAVYVITGMVAIHSVLLLLNIFIVKRQVGFPHWKVDTKMMKYILRESWPVALMNISFFLYIQFDTIMIGKIRTDAEVGLYNAAYQLVISLFSVSYLFATVLQPRFSRLYKESHEELKAVFNKSLTLLTAIGLPLTLTLAVLSERIVLLLYGQNFNASAAPLRILSFVLFFTFLNVTITTLFISINRQRIALITCLVGVACNIILNLLFIPQYGIIGAASTTLVTEVVIFLIAFIALGRSFYRPPFMALTWRSVVASVLFVIPLYLLRELSLIPLILLIIFFFLTSHTIIKTIPREDLSLFLAPILERIRRNE